MKNIKFLLFLTAILLLTACSSDDEGMDHDDHDHEHENINLLISDAHSTTLNFINPYSEALEIFEAAYPKGSIYVTETGRYSVITHRDNNFTETFNIGGKIDHGDHDHDLGEPGLAAISFESEKPTHFKSEQGYVGIYNDGDATLSIFNEKSIYNASTVNTISTGTTAHHGAMVFFKSGNIAVTNLGAGTGLPEKVHIINQEGEVISDASQSLSTSGIHGSAGSNETAVFGSNTGILVVKDNGDQKIIDYPSDFDTNVWFGSLLATSESNIFVGYTSSKGVYLIDITSEEITPVHETSELFKCIVSRDGEQVISLTKGGDYKITEVATQDAAHEGVLDFTMDTESTDHGSVTSNIDFYEDFLYVSIPSTKNLVQYHVEDKEVENEFQLDITPYQFKVLAYEMDH
ncbi:hypothetical protein [Pseudotamlana agarivorans]|uniref:hypothetical protein n=1 Tax=Pseudotamlana agarivorans TaxID=481183 RepID=UPI0008362925|nr:hypothetical protein [Tamlana agarivorans]